MAELSPRRRATIIWGALVAGVTTFFVVSLVVSMPGNGALADALLAATAGMSLVTVAVSWLWAVRMRPAAGAAATLTPEALGTTRLIIAAALCEGSALFAIVAHLVTRDDRMFLPFAVSFVGLVAHFPGDRHWARLSGGAAAGGVPRNPMIRG